MELYQLRTFAVVADLGNLRQAAEKLHVSQPAASAQIKMLEEEFGIALFERKQSGLHLTQAGERLKPKILQLLAVASEITSDAKGLSGQVTGPIRLGIIGTIDKSIVRLEEMMKVILRRRAKVEISLQHQNSRSIVAGVANREFEAGICMCSSKIPGIRCIPLKKINHRIVAPTLWGGNIRKASWRELAALPWISVPRGGSHHNMIMQLFRRLRMQPNKYVVADSEPIITSLVLAGAGMALMREELALQLAADKQIIVVDKGRPSIFLNFIYRKGCDNDPAIQAISKVLADVWSEARWASLTGTAVSKQPLDVAPINVRSMPVLLRKAAK